MTEQKNSSPEDQANQLIEALNRNTEAQTQLTKEQRLATAAQMQMAQAILALVEQVAAQNEINAALLDVIADDGEDDEQLMPATLNQRRQ